MRKNCQVLSNPVSIRFAVPFSITLPNLTILQRSSCNLTHWSRINILFLRFYGFSIDAKPR